ncbi:MAG TPA: hypothetical protein VKU41_09120, partial [Polyangiaceae bacterium]|nr:hypothetical protein [Polyangiaceae bacterium]
MHAALVALGLAIFTALGYGHHPQARAIAEANAVAIESRDVPATGESHAVDLAVLELYEVLESHLDDDAVSYDPLAGGGMSCGLLQQRCPMAWRFDIEWRAKEWLREVHSAGLGSVDSSPTRARARLGRARDVLRTAL